ncbi:unnamed protein product, partial [Ilex paraguariensis]
DAVASGHDLIMGEQLWAITKLGAKLEKPPTTCQVKMQSGMGITGGNCHGHAID